MGKSSHLCIWCFLDPAVAGGFVDVGGCTSVELVFEPSMSSLSLLASDFFGTILTYSPSSFLTEMIEDSINAFLSGL